MQQRLFVSDAQADVLTAYEATSLKKIVSQRIVRPGAICAWDGEVFCASLSEASIWRLSADSLMPLQRIAAAPGIHRLRAVCGSLYALSSDADSLLMLDLARGTPQMLTRVGVQPRDLAVDPTGRLVAVAGGASCSVLILSGETLALQRSIDVDGVAVGVGFAEDCLWVLCAVGQEELSSSLLRVRLGTGQVERRLLLEGMPGGIAILPDQSVLIGLLDGIVMVARHAKRVAWRIQIDGGLPDAAALLGRYAFWADGLSSCVWCVDTHTASMVATLTDFDMPGGILIAPGV